MFGDKPTRKPRQDARAVATYTIPEAAQFLAISQWTLGEWYEGEDPVLRASGTYQDKGNIRLLSFWDLEEAYKVHLLRTVHKKSMQYLQKALADARKITRSDHPLLDFEMLVFNHLALSIPSKQGKPAQMVPLGSAVPTSLYIGPVVEAWGRRIVLDNEGKGTKLFPWRNVESDDVSRPVSIDANVLSGQLVVTGTRVPVSTLAAYRDSGKTEEQIAELYRLDLETVRKALEHLEPTARRAS